MNTKWIVLAAAATIGLAAQNPAAKITAVVPFAFDAKGVNLASGTYELIQSDRQAFVTLRNTATGKSVMLIGGAKSANRRKDNSLEFKRYNDVYFLTAVSYEAAGLKIQMPNTKREKEMAIAITPEVIVARAW